MSEPDFQSLRLFMRVAETQSFTAAADASGISVSAASYAVRTLEAQLGARLFNRTTRSVSLTEAGGAFMDRVAPLLEELQLAMHDVSVASNVAMGTLRLNIPSTASRLIIEPLLRRFLAAHPNISLDVAVDNSLVDIVTKGYDAGIRFDSVLGDDMVAIPLIASVPFIVAASPEYVAARGTPRHPRDLLKHECINYRSADSGALYKWEFEERDEAPGRKKGGVKGQEKGKPLRLAVTGRVSSNDTGLLLRAACDGFGFAYLARESAAAALAEGRLVEVLHGWTSPAALYLYYYNRAAMPMKLRVFIDFLQAEIGRPELPLRAGTVKPKRKPRPTAREAAGRPRTRA
ncbi:LysR family transcriptional regulator [Cupriavidus plantarum]|uniref:DNA-binding transcriptional LysR family regulator n=1 Tax=Cupriavidus plantarum TaxID=942865 RepID=A0A316ETY3_9BURK|nr:LysR family transcriptional regulator [Cupriavidus plantarum]NYH99003.1 DNA-binding transcriptional LysR family regulator [Cupriavidus plantarum]PWK36227.1 DNA-binding transcriptional LysR family regulator [Cupriavidus plantarum]REF03020.1 DNA-binding transcriptional LysR family regulator [Cupriavidus plantarum]RLK44114.1 DNA-binding transcriptional LysR family regulator [Cupriavidus plantarum]CAG2141525.1 HTH-type transcriptional regulator PgrR [Cupriavidus plantarum]